MNRFIIYLLLSLGCVVAYAEDTDEGNPTQKEYDALPADMFSVKLGATCTEGIQFEFTPKDALMPYTNILVDELYLTVDSLGDLDFAQQIVNVSNRMIDMVGGFEQAMHADFFYVGPVADVGFGGQIAGKRLFFAVMGVAYDEATGKVSAATKVTRSEVFEIVEGSIPKDAAWADISAPVYKTYKGKNVVEVTVTPNEQAVGYVYGKTYPADYRKTHSDTEIISELTSVSNMMETWVADWDMHLRCEMSPGESRLFAVTCLEKDSGKITNKLNWVVLTAPAELGADVIVESSASGNAGVIAAEAPASELPVRYYNMQGVPVDNPSVPGLYIRRKGNESSTVIIR